MKSKVKSNYKKVKHRKFTQVCGRKSFLWKVKFANRLFFPKNQYPEHTLWTDNYSLEIQQRDFVSDGDAEAFHLMSFAEVVLPRLRTLVINDFRFRFSVVSNRNSKSESEFLLLIIETPRHFWLWRVEIKIPTLNFDYSEIEVLLIMSASGNTTRKNSLWPHPPNTGIFLQHCRRCIAFVWLPKTWL